MIGAAAPGVRLCLSHDIGTVGLLGRENAALLNASLLPLADRVSREVPAALAALGLDAPVYWACHDGTAVGADDLARRPLSTYDAAAANAMRGAFALTGLADAVVVDVGERATSVGALSGGFPRAAGEHRRGHRGGPHPPADARRRHAGGRGR